MKTKVTYAVVWLLCCFGLTQPCMAKDSNTLKFSGKWFLAYDISDKAEPDHEFILKRGYFTSQKKLNSNKMKTLLINKVARIIKSRKKLEELLNVKITNRGKEVTITGKPEDEYIAEKVIDALNFGFPFSSAMQIKNKDCIFEILNIKDYTKRHDLKRIKARIIGKQGKAVNTLRQLTKCDFEIKDNTVGIIGPAEFIEGGQDAVISIIKGAKHSNIYNRLEKNQPKKIEDLGLKVKDNL